MAGVRFCSKTESSHVEFEKFFKKQLIYVVTLITNSKGDFMTIYFEILKKIGYFA